MTLLLLLGLSVALAVAAPPTLATARWTVRAPRLAVLAWEATATTLVLCVLAAVVTMVMPWHRADDAVCAVWRVCLDAVVGAHGVAALLFAWTGLFLLAVGLVRIGTAAVRLARLTVRRRRHADLVRIVGRRQPGMDATVVDHPEPAVYLVPGSPDQIVVTTGALSRLGRDELDAVLAHERAHARGRHHLLLALAVLLHQAFPGVAVFGQADRQIRRLVEICADDDACRGHSRLALARALVRLARPESAPPGVIAAGGGDAVERVHRLMDPPPPLPRRTQAAVAAALFALPVMPLALVLAIPAVPVLAAGPPLW